MYFWSIKKLKADLLRDRLTERAKLSYLIFVLLAVSGAFVGVPQHNFYSAIWAGVLVASIVFGSILAYRWNGGSSGRDFLSRFVSLAWVCCVRWTVLFVVPLMVIAVTLPTSNLDFVSPISPTRPVLGLPEIVLEAFIVPPLFWRVAANMRDLAYRSIELEEESTFTDYATLEPLEE